MFSGLRGNCAVLENIGRYYQRRQEDDYQEAQLDFSLLQLYAMLSRSMEKERLQADSRQGKLGEALDRIHSRLEEDINIEELSRELGMSSRYAAKTFEDSIGISCSQYITNAAHCQGKGAFMGLGKRYYPGGFSHRIQQSPVFLPYF